MQRQHRQLHTHEQVLRYQLQQKRRMLNELKDELEYCRRKWALAREKNNESQSQWNDLRSEFSRRKLEDANNSGESGYSDEPVSDDENSDDESVKVKTVSAQEMLTPASKKLLRVHSVSPIRSETSKKRDKSAPPVSTFLTQVFQTTSEIVPNNLTLQASVVSKPVENLNLNYAASASVVEPKTAAKITVKNVSCEGPSPSTSRGVKPKCVDEVRPRLSRELRKKAIKVKEKRKGEETLEQMFFRLSGQEPPEPEEEEEEPNKEQDEEIKDYEEMKNEQTEKVDQMIVEHEVLRLVPNLVSNDVVDESPDVEEISSIILSEEDEERRMQRAARFQRLEEQCQQLITQVINNSNRGDELNLQLDNVQRRYIPTRENSKSVEKSDEEQGAVGCSSEMEQKEQTECLTQREQEYTSRRAERLKRLEEECKEFLNKQNKSKIRATEMSNKLDRLHQRYGSQESPEASSSEDCEARGAVLRAEEEAYSSRRAERLKRLEEQSAELLERMSQSANRASNIESTLDELHNKFGEKEDTKTNAEECAVDNIILDDESDQGDVLSLVQSIPSSFHDRPQEILENENDIINEETIAHTQNETNNPN